MLSCIPGGVLGAGWCIFPMLSYMAVLDFSSRMIWRVGCGGVVLFIVSVRIECVVYNGCFIFSVGCLVFFLWIFICAYFMFYTLQYTPGSWLYSADCDTGDPGSNPARWHFFFSQLFFFVERKYNFIFPWPFERETNWFIFPFFCKKTTKNNFSQPYFGIIK